MASLFVIQGRDQGKRFDLELPVVGLGRDGVNTFQVHDDEVSRQHVEIRKTGDTFEVVDLDSSNGTYFRARRGESIPFGSLMLVGQHLFRVDPG